MPVRAGMARVGSESNNLVLLGVGRDFHGRIID